MHEELHQFVQNDVWELVPRPKGSKKLTSGIRAIRANLESRGWLSLLEIDHPPPTALIREFFSNLSCHIYDSNTIVQSWIRGVEFTITPRVVAQALRVPVVTDPVYPYDKSPPIDVVMSHITGSSIQWGF